MNASIAKHEKVVFAILAMAITLLACFAALCFTIPCLAHAATNGLAPEETAFQVATMQEQASCSNDSLTAQATHVQGLTTQATKKATLYVDSATQKTKTLTAKGLKAKKATWKSTKPKVATVKSGKITAKKAGKTTVTAKQGSKKFKFAVAVKKVSISKKSATLHVGESLVLALKGDKIAGAKSSDDSVASVTKAGKVTANKAGKAGKATIILKSKKGKEYTCVVTVQRDAVLDEGLSYWFGIDGKTFDTTKAHAAFQKSADGGNAEAWYWLGDVRRYDQDADRWPEVLGFYQTAANAGSAYGYYGLGTLYATGYGVDKDIEKAIGLYQQAADGGCLMGCVGLGDLYSNNSRIDNGIEIDGAKAKAYYTSALGSADFQTRNAARVGLGDMYRYGRGVTIDETEALKWYKMAADEGYYLGCQHMGDTYRSDYGITVASSQAEAEANAAQMLSWYEKERAGGFAYSLGEVYLNGIDVAADPAYAREIFQEALDKGDRSAALCICGFVLMNANGIGMSKNKTAAIDWCYKAIDACGPFDDSDDPNDRLHKPLPYARYVLEHYNQPLVRP